MTGLVDGKAGFHGLWSRLRKARVGSHWYAVALLTAPLLISTILIVLSQTSPAFLPAIATTQDKVGLFVTGIVMGLIVGFFEELGWTVFAVPRLRQRFGVITSGILMGLLWGAWHFPLFLSSMLSSGSFPPAPLLDGYDPGSKSMGLFPSAAEPMARIATTNFPTNLSEGWEKNLNSSLIFISQIFCHPNPN